MTERAVVIAGAGPTGLMLAAELALAKVDVVVLERRKSQELAGSRAGGLHARSLEILDQRGIVDRFVREGQVTPFAGYALFSLDLRDFPSRHNYVLGLWQNHIERILAAWVRELGVPIEYGRDVTGFSQDGAGVDVETADGRPLRARYLVGCDGGRSAIRKAAGIDFPGWDASISHLIAELEVAVDPEFGIRRDASGTHGFSRVNYEIRDGKIVYADHGPIRVMITEKQPGARGEPTLQDLREAVTGVYGRDFGIDRPIWISRFTDMSRQATSYRDRRVLLAGDAAHIHGPPGGQGLNTGVQDAVNLGWKLAQVVKGASPDTLLDSYHAERHPVAARVLQNTMAQTALMRTDDRTNALRTTVAELLQMDEPRKRVAAEITALDIRYDLGTGHPLLGRRMPDLDLVTADGTRRVFSYMSDARPLLVTLGTLDGVDIRGWNDRVRLVEATYEGKVELPVLGVVATPRAVLVRPDGYVAWVGEQSAAGLGDALHTWCGVTNESPGTLRSP